MERMRAQKARWSRCGVEKIVRELTRKEKR